ncbi:hypothetical protein KR074_007232, partial [Drosophila pseudoananassae]
VPSLVLLPKPGKPPEDPSSLRPICLIDHAGKALERCICRRLQEAVISAGDLSPLQYGFREHRSTVNAISLISSARRLYVSDRTIRYETTSGIREHAASCGVPQGSVLGPALWNVMYDGVLRLDLPERTHLVGFADDIAVAAVAKTIQEAEEHCNAAIANAIGWLEQVGLSLAHHKTEAVLISSRKRVESASITVGRHVVTSSRAIRYL